MPELPEVETIRRTIAPAIVGKEIVRVEVLTPKMLLGASPAEFCQTLRGRRFQTVERRGKYLLFQVEEVNQTRAAKAPANFWLIIHLKMAGRLLLHRTGDPLEKHTHILWGFADGTELRYVDLRHFGRVVLWSGEQVPGLESGRPAKVSAPGEITATPELVSGLERLGPEPLSAAFTLDYLRAGLAGRKGRVKSLLLDQTFIAGLGNIYADEVLHRAGIHPEREARQLQLAEVERLYAAIREILTEAIALRGTTFATYVDGEGRKGEFANRLAVYGRDGQACPRCGTPVVRRRLGGRSAHFCPHCQR